ncbi:MAG: M20/M25/M40 family metallo-hydrolase, partial [Microbacterium sp.]|uniref:M20/M25/M40 family metallo-hydrolase n=1 Tax=Microbacterium sp. TaxID=51671 RepID=UPI0039E41325
PPRVTAVRRVARAVDRLGPSTFRPRTPKAVSAMLARFAERAHGGPRLLYRLLASTPPLAARLFAALGGETAALVRTTVAATMQSGGTAFNVLPSQASATVNLRIVPGETIASVVQRVRRRIADPKVEVAVVEGHDPSPESPVDAAQFALVAAAVQDAYPAAVTVPYLMMQASDSRHFHRFSPAVYRFAPLRMSAAQRASIHGVDERVELASLEAGERFHRALIEGLT